MSSLVANLVIKQIPVERFIVFVKKIDLESENKDELINKYMNKTKYLNQNLSNFMDKSKDD